MGCSTVGRRDVESPKYAPACQFTIWSTGAGECGLTNEDALRAERTVDRLVLVCEEERFGELSDQVHAAVESKGRVLPAR